ncbi:MAG: DUF4292 domain-containing protein [Bacteroidota bacterium]
MNNALLWITSLVVLGLLYGCTPTRITLPETGTFNKTDIAPGAITKNIPDYSREIQSVKGRGRAVISEPGNSDRITLSFDASRSLSLITIKNRLGIEGGAMLVDQDSILIYNKIDKEAQKVSVYDNRLTSLNELASVNLIDLLNYRIDSTDVQTVYEDDDSYLLETKGKTRIFLSKKSNTIWRVIHPPQTNLPYSEIQYDSYSTLDGYVLPRKITIFSADARSRVALAIRSLDLNPEKLNLSLSIPESILIQRL